MLVDGETVLDGFTDPPPRGATLIGLVSEEISAEVALTAGEPVDVVVEGTGEGAPGTIRGAVIGLRPPDPGDLIERAAAAAAGCDAAVLVVGTTDEWESEGQDRTSMDLPGDQDALVEAVLDANPDTIVVVNAGSPVAMPWADHARAVLHVVRRPGDGRRARRRADRHGRAGRPPADHPAAAARAHPVLRQLPGRERRGPLRRGRAGGLPLVRRPPPARAVPLRPRALLHDFEIGEPRPAADTFAPGGALAVEVDVTNTSDRAGSEVVQLYVEPPPSELARPPRELRAYAKVHLAPGETTTVSLELTDRAFAYWDPGDPSWDDLRPRAAVSPMIRADEERRTTGGWRVDPGTYVLHAGRSSADLPDAVPISVG